MRWSVLIFVGFACSFSASTEEDTSEQPAIAFEFTMSGADELSGTIQVPVILSHAAETEVRVGYSLRDGNNATPGVDFELVTGTLVFAPGEQRKELPVRIMDDTDETEAVETFEIALSRPIGATLDEVRAIHSVRIADHILPRVTVGPGPTTASEASPTKLVIKLDRPSEGQSTVVIGVSGGAPAAASASDVTLLDGTQIVIPSGATSVNVPIGEKDDALDEEDHEIVVFTLRGASANLVIGTASSLAHAISDNDAPPTLGFTLATATLGEGGGAE
ncbi:MAG TPA: Calx-beta domain-containing protein, partial [Kofleriaceae bacterium]|nr:Calx-beta domain-containing protein [Kofleriaceae bacterium]